eukprot:scaffold382256_cov27-Prasinocladus_malaysianus.AAC.1
MISVMKAKHERASGVQGSPGRGFGQRKSCQQVDAKESIEGSKEQSNLSNGCVNQLENSLFQ